MRKRTNKHGPGVFVIHNGVRYNRYPESERRDLRVYWTSSKGKKLHRVLYEEAHGPIGAGLQVHHVDGDPLNNALDNLALVTAAEHLAEHWTPERAAKCRAVVERIRPLASEWHRSEAGRAWHREHAKAVAACAVVHPCTCTVCGRGFESKCRTAAVCGAGCHAAKRRASGVDDRPRTCPWCKREYVCNMYSRQKFCSRSCLARSTNAKRAAARLQSAC